MDDSESRTKTAGVRADYQDRLEALIAHPRMDEAMRCSVRLALDYFHSHPLMHRNIKDVGRLILGSVALYLDATGGLTHRRLRVLSGKTGVISAGTATAVLFRMRTIGYVVRDPDGGAGTVRRYRPTEEMIEAFRDRMRIELDAAGLLLPDAAAVSARLNEPVVFQALFREMGAHSIKAASDPRPDIDPINRLSVRSAGVLVLYELLSNADDGGVFAGPAELSVSVSELARKFEISRSHVLSLLRDLEAAGYIARAGRDGRWTIEPPMRQAVTTLFGVIYLGMAHIAGEVRRAVG